MFFQNVTGLLDREDRIAIKKNLKVVTRRRDRDTMTQVDQIQEVFDDFHFTGKIEES